MAQATKNTQTPASLRILAGQLAANAESLKGAADAMEALGIASVVVTHENSRRIGWNGVDAFTVAVRVALRDYKPAENEPKKRIRLRDTGTGG